MDVATIRHFSRQLVREWNILGDEIQPFGLSPTQCHALIEIDQQAELPASELAQLLVLDKSTISRTIQDLDHKGLVETNIPDIDKRQKRYTLNDAGRQILDTIHQVNNEKVGYALELLLPEERQKVLEGLQLYAKALRQTRLQSAYLLRPIEPQDNAGVARVIRTVMTEFGAVGEGYSIMDPEVDQMYESYTNDRSAFFVIEKEGEIFGCGGIAPLTGAAESICELRKMYFFPALRGLGFGKRLLQVCLEAARQLGYQQCYLETLERMWQANKLYQKMGFQALSSTLGNTGHSACDRFLVLDL